MSTVQTRPYGSWKSPITPEMVTAGVVGFEHLVTDGADIYWSEVRPSERGRSVIVRRTPDGRTTDMTPAPLSARTRVHEYGGASFTVVGGTLFFTGFADQHLYRQDPGQEPRVVHAEPQMRYADFAPDRGRHRLICIREDHNGPAVINTVVALDMETDAGQVLVEGNDFYASPRLSPDGKQLAWLTWNHPNMPWDGTELWVGEIGTDGGIRHAQCVAGGPEESIFQPAWSPEGILHFVSDRTGWWNLYSWDGSQTAALLPMEAEFGEPQWVFGMSTYAFVAPDRILCTYAKNGHGQMAAFDTRSRRLEPVAVPFTDFGHVTAGDGYVAFVSGSHTEPVAVVRLDPASGRYERLRTSFTMTLDEGYLSVPRAVEFPTEDGLTAFGLYYPPQNRDYVAPAGERPPLIVVSHGGPTAAASGTLGLGLQYWTSRGFAILDVNYGGSTGYGRAYRERLNGRWGIVDVDDCANGARYLAAEGLADPERLAIRGGSAGGYTTLAALTFRDVFKAGASFFGVSDLEALASDTHKFESRYLDRLVGPYPAARETYRERSPIHAADRLSCPVIFFQGLDDKVVPPNQAEAMVDVLRAKGLPVAYLAFEGEGHGFRRAENNRRTLEAQLYFFGRVFGFEPADQPEPIAIDNL